MTDFYAHSANKNGDWELLIDHLRDVAKTAGCFAAAFDAEKEAFLAGLLHDIGKGGDLFQQRLQGLVSGVDHWSPGAWAALVKARSIASALAVQGHHVGLQQADKTSLKRLAPTWIRDNNQGDKKIDVIDNDKAISWLGENGCNLPDSLTPMFPSSLPETVSAMLDVRMLFSALVDADYLETEAHFEAEPGKRKSFRENGPALEASTALNILNQYIDDRRKFLQQKNAVDQGFLELRNRLLADCLSAANSNPGLFTLSAPTGSGKTLSMLAFALAHAAANPDTIRRVIFVIPYLSIIEQTASIYREIFSASMGQEYVLEHHSLSDLRKDNGGNRSDEDQQNIAERARRLSHNWDAPLIVTTSVQILESLFANKPTACRKLHRIAGSIILFDEVQTLPVHLAVPTLKALAHLVHRYKCSVVFATATQPAFRALDAEVRKEQISGWAPKEIIENPTEMFLSAKRTKIDFCGLNQRKSWEELAVELQGEKQVLCILNLKRHALELLNDPNLKEQEGTFHLSTNMCPSHRVKVLDEIRERLTEGKCCRLISTQCIEAGVDVDFPVVYRAYGPLEAIAQAAGRCNRNGKQSLGEVRVFLPEDESYPGGAYKQAVAVLTSLIRESPDDWFSRIDDPKTFDLYFRKLYSLAEPEKANKNLQSAIEDRDFAAVAQAYRLIENNAVNILVPYDLEIYRALKDRARSEGLSAGWIKEARSQSVSIYRPSGKDAAVWSHLESVPVGFGPNRRESEDWFICRDENHYDRDLIGLDIPESTGIWIA